MSQQLLKLFDANARRNPDAIAVRFTGGTPSDLMSQAQLRDQTFSIAQVLRNRFAPSATILLSYPNRPEFIPAFLGVLAANCTLFPVSFDSAEPELAGAAHRSSAVAAIVDRAVAESLKPVGFDQIHPLPQLSPSAVLLSKSQPDPKSMPTGPALLLQSSGTTAEPKIVRRDAASLDAVTKNMIEACGFTENDHVLAAVPLCHSYGLEHGILAPIAAGSCVHVCQKFDLPLVLHELREGGITMMPGVPFMFDMLCQTEDIRFPTLRVAYSAGGPLPRSTFDSFKKKFALKIGQVYGSTEVGSVTFNNPAHPSFDPASVGRAMAGVSIKILHRDDPQIASSLPPGADGLVAIRAPSMFSGYLDSDSVSFIDGHYFTGDIGHLLPDGNLTITGRLNLLIDIGGRKVNPLEVESVFCQHPEVGQCMVVPLRLSDTVQRLKAIVTPSNPDAPLSISELREFAQKRLSPYKVPRVIEIRDSLPTSPAGKLLRRMV
jgi:acyl-CoA synthetase (AMP-forming)/AMP-acid ligase II